MKIDTDKFIWLYEQQEFKTLTELAQSGLASLLSYIQADEHIQDIRWAAYMLATVHRECGQEWQPIKEYSRGKGRKYGAPDPMTGQVYYGRGYVQLTWKGNYAAMGKVCGVDLVNDPDLTLQPDIAYRIMSHGMRHGSFTGVGLPKYINSEKCDYFNARKIINGLDVAQLIADNAVKFERMIRECEVA